MYRNVLKPTVVFGQPGWHYFNVSIAWSLLYSTAYHKTGYAPHSAPNFGNKVGFIDLKQRLGKRIKGTVTL